MFYNRGVKIFSLNAWHGTRAAELREFLAAHRDELDVFCFQEANGDAIEQIFAEIFPESEFATATSLKTIENQSDYCVRAFAKKPISLESSAKILDDGDAETGCGLLLELKTLSGAKISVATVHGVPFPGHKLDTTGRIRQTEQVISRMSGAKNAVICGDFNLLPAAESVKLFAKNGFRNMIADYGVKTTRNRLAWADYPGREQLFADYAFVRGAEVRDFSVPRDEISDHQPLVVDIEIE